MRSGARALLLAFAVPSIVAAQDNPPLKQLSLEALADVQVITVSKEPEEVRRVPAAVHVITAEDIRRSGATSVPEVLRMAPGVNVARIDTTHWSVGIRGFGDQFSKSLLVLIDGRSVYTPLFGGVFWATLDTPLEDIERIEIIRGPGGTIWGSNAVNGVINIVTKHASSTDGLLTSVSAGNVDELLATVRYGSALGATASYRLYGRFIRRGPQRHVDDANFDDWSMGQGGGRVDWRDGRDEVTVQGDLYGSRIGQSVSLASFDPPAQVMHHDPADLSGGNVMATWRRAFTDASLFQVRGYFDRTDVSGPQIRETRNTTDVDVTYSLQPQTRHGILVGAGARISPSRVTQTVPTLDVAPHDDMATIYAGFVRDSIALVPDRLDVTLGAKFEHYTYTGVEVQPSARVLWTPSELHSVWAGVTRAVRTPSRLERAFTLYGFLADEPPTYIRVNGNDRTTSERLLGIGAGYRGVIGSNLYLDIAGFSNDHDDLQSFGAPSVVVENGRLIFALPYANGISGRSTGIEIAPQWVPTSWWQVKGYYAYLQLDLENQPGSNDQDSVETYEGSSPRHQITVDSRLTLPHGWELDQTVRWVSSLPAREVDGYTTFGVRVGRAVSDGLTLAVTASNLLDAAHLEFGHDPPPAVGIRRSVVVSATWIR